MRNISYQNDDVPKTFASYLVRFNPDEDIVLPEYLAAFLSSKQGVWDIKRRARQSINQTNVNPEEVKEIFIPILPVDFQKEIQKRYIDANKKRVLSLSLYRQVEQLLLKTIGFNDFKSVKKNKNIKNLKESFFTTGRLDAEYYLPKYEDYLQLIKNYPNGFDKLQNVCILKDSNYNPDETKEYQYIELSDIGKSGNITGCIVAKGKELPSRARRKVQTNDVIISSIEGSSESCALVTNEFNHALCSTGFYVINSSIINSETLLVLFKSEVIQQIIKQNCSGTILTAINKSDFLHIPVPLIDCQTQRQIAALIEESFTLRQASERLLQEAKELVEREIEK